MLQNKIIFQQNLINTLPIPVFYTNKNGLIEGCNNAFQKLTGKSIEKLIGKRLPGIIPPDQLEFHKKENEIVFKHITPRVSEGRIIGANDKLLDVIFYKSPLSLGNEADIGLIETIVDITEKNKSDEKIRQSEERYALATLATRDGIWDWNLENEKLYIAPRFAEILGINSNDDDFGFDFEKLENHIYTGDLQLFLYQVQLIKEGIKESFDIEMRMVRTDGTIIWTNLKVFGICNKDDEVVRLIGSLSDIQERKDAEIQMRKWEEIFMNTQMGIAILNPVNLTIELLNPMLAHIHDYEQFELKEQKLEILISAEFKDTIKEAIDISDYNGHHLLEAVNTKKDGSSFPTLININTVKDKKNKPVYIIINVQDISIRKAHEREIDRMLHYEQTMNEELRSNEEELKQMLEQTVKLKEKVEQSQLQYIHFLNGTTDFAILKDNELNYLHINKSFAEYLGKDPEYFIGKNDFDVLPRETAELIQKQDNQVLKGRTMILFENEYNHKYFETRRFPVYYEKGKIGVGAFIREITRQKLIEQQLQKNELRFKTLLENAFDAIMIVDERGIINYCTDVIETITGIKAEDLIGTSMSLIVHKDDRPLFNENLKRVVQVPGYSETILYRSVDSKNQPRFIESFAKNHLDNKLINGILITSRDISIEHQTMELKKSIELAKRSAEMKQQFLSNMSHEIRTPMNGIVGMIEFLIKTNLDEKQKDYVETIRDSADSLLNIINDILDFSKIEAGKMTINPTLVNIRNFASNTGKLFQALAKQKEIRFLINIDDSIPENVLLDSIRLNQVVSNLVSNAVKFTPQGEVLLNFKNEGITGERINLLIEVRDTGIGITSEDQKKLFSSFSQIDSSLTRTMEGTGLGLAISQKIVKLMEGELKVESIQGKGSRFWFVIQPKIATDIITESDQDQDKNINFKQVKLDLSVLLVEDKMVNQKVIKLMLNSMGCKVTIADNGQDAINLIRKNRKKNKDIIPVFDIIIMDIQMPVMDGITATKLIRQNFPEYKTIIGMSANAITSEINSFIESGLDDYIIKPAKSHEIYQKLMKWKQIDRI
jgi:PAS domain S-box-containing protein